MLIEPIKSSNPRSPGTLLCPFRSPDNCIRLVTECTHCKSFNLNINMIIHYHYICLRCPNDSCYIILYTVICFDMLYIYIYTSFNLLAWSIKQCYPNICWTKACHLKNFCPPQGSRLNPTPWTSHWSDGNTEHSEHTSRKNVWTWLNMYDHICMQIVACSLMLIEFQWIWRSPLWGLFATSFRPDPWLIFTL